MSSYLREAISSDPEQWRRDRWASDESERDLSWEIVVGLGGCNSRLCLAPVVHQPGQPAVWEARRPLLGRASQVGSIDGLYERIVPDVDAQCQDAEAVVRSLLAKVGCLNATTVQLHARWIDADKSQQNCDEANIMLFNLDGEPIVEAADLDDGRRLCVETIFGGEFCHGEEDGENQVNVMNNTEGEQIFFHQFNDPSCSFERLAKYCATEGISRIVVEPDEEAPRRGVGHTQVQRRTHRDVQVDRPHVWNGHR